MCVSVLVVCTVGQRCVVFGQDRYDICREGGWPLGSCVTILWLICFSQSRREVYPCTTDSGESKVLVTGEGKWDD